MEAMCTTFHLVCQALDLNCDEFNPMTNLVVSKIGLHPVRLTPA
jgi:hypothetical protein